MLNPLNAWPRSDAPHDPCPPGVWPAGCPPKPQNPPPKLSAAAAGAGVAVLLGAPKPEKPDATGPCSDTDLATGVDPNTKPLVAGAGCVADGAAPRRPPAEAGGAEAVGAREGAAPNENVGVADAGDGAAGLGASVLVPNPPKLKDGVAPDAVAVGGADTVVAGVDPKPPKLNNGVVPGAVVGVALPTAIAAVVGAGVGIGVTVDGPNENDGAVGAAVTVRAAAPPKPPNENPETCAATGAAADVVAACDSVLAPSPPKLLDGVSTDAVIDVALDAEVPLLGWRLCPSPCSKLSTVRRSSNKELCRTFAASKPGGMRADSRAIISASDALPPRKGNKLYASIAASICSAMLEDIENCDIRWAAVLRSSTLCGSLRRQARKMTDMARSGRIGSKKTNVFLSTAGWSLTAMMMAP
ncbi:hypothetical protein BC831DRAFT_493885 [Entophlyctis helioformis]|nr:hypothetical protein BC831DRAFT_493885 [Entophlyctis helioformis]